MNELIAAGMVDANNSSIHSAGSTSGKIGLGSSVKGGVNSRDGSTSRQPTAKSLDSGSVIDDADAVLQMESLKLGGNLDVL
jgi:hypothetical protein